MKANRRQRRKGFSTVLGLGVRTRIACVQDGCTTTVPLVHPYLQLHTNNGMVVRECLKKYTAYMHML